MKLLRIISPNFILKTNGYSYSTLRNQSSTQYCLDLVKKHDYENFLCTILMSNKSRNCALAVRAFNVEISKIAQQEVAQESIGLLKLKFWEDVVDNCFKNDFNKIPRQPVALELYKAINQTKLSKKYFKNLISCRKMYLSRNIFDTLDEMEKYVESSVSNNYYLILEGCGVRNVNADHAASHLGKAQGLVKLLRSLPLIAILKFIPIPQDVLIKNNLSFEDIYRGHKTDVISDCVFEIATRAHQHFVKSKGLMDNLPEESRQAFLSIVPVGIYLEQLEKCDYNVFHKQLNSNTWKLVSKLLYYRFTNKV